jgi:hypothetical protein
MFQHQHEGAIQAPGPFAPERPEKDDARELGGGAGIEVQGTADSPDYRKTVATLQAQAAISGFSVEPIEADDGRHGFIVARWNLSRQCDTADEVRELLRRMGAAL